MSNYRNHREPRRRGFDDERSQEPDPDYFQRETRPSPVVTNSPSVDVEVLWFNADKGFGFVKLADGSNAFLHVSALERAGHRAVSEGMEMSVRIGQGQKGPQVAEVLEVHGPKASVAGSPSFAPQTNAMPTASTADMPGTVKWYNSDKGFGFIAIAGASKDAFVHVSVLKRCGADSLAEGQLVVVEVKEGQRGLEVTSLKPA